MKRRSRITTAIAMGALALAAPAGAGAAVAPVTPFPVATLPAAGVGGGALLGAIGGNQIGSAGCVGTNRPSIGGNNGSTSAQTCGTLLSFAGPQIGQIASVIGSTIIGSPLARSTVSAGPVTEVIPSVP
jgi:hypothetical protein